MSDINPCPFDGCAERGIHGHGTDQRYSPVTDKPGGVWKITGPDSLHEVIQAEQTESLDAQIDNVAAQIQPLIDQARAEGASGRDVIQSNADAWFRRYMALRGRVEALAEDFRQALLRTPGTDDNDTYGDGYGNALAHVIGRLRALLADAPDNTTAGNGGEPA